MVSVGGAAILPCTNNTTKHSVSEMGKGLLMAPSCMGTVLTTLALPSYSNSFQT